MKMRSTPAAALVWWLLLSPAAAVEETPSLEELRDAQAGELEALRDEYRQRAQGMGPAAEATLTKEYSSKKSAIQERYKARDPRTREIGAITEKYAGQVANTGSKPKDVRADVDLAAKTAGAYDGVAGDWGAAGHQVEPIVVDGIEIGQVNKTTDTTLWKPSTPEIEAAKAKYHDAFSTEGGRQGAGNVDAAYDPAGFQIDNEKKMLHGLETGDTKTVAKSVDKAAEASGLKNADDPFYRQTDGLRSYGDPVEAGIAKLSDPPEVEAEKLQGWNAEAERRMAEARAVANERATVSDQAKTGLRQALENAPEVVEGDAQVNRDYARQIEEKQQRIRESNERTEAENARQREALERQRAAAPDGDEPAARSAAAAAATDVDAPKTTRQKVADGLDTGGKIASGLDTAGQLAEAGTRRAGQAIDENRDLTAGDAGGALLDMTGVGAVAEGVYDTAKRSAQEEYAAAEAEGGSKIVAGAKALGRTAAGTVKSVVVDPVAQAYGEDGVAGAAGQLTGIRPLANAFAEVEAWGARGDAAAQRAALQQKVDDELRWREKRIRDLASELERLGANGDPADPRTAQEMERRIDELRSQEDRLRRAAAMAERTLGESDPERVRKAQTIVAAVPRSSDVEDYARQLLRDRTRVEPPVLGEPTLPDDAFAEEDLPADDEEFGGASDEAIEDLLAEAEEDNLDELARERAGAESRAEDARERVASIGSRAAATASAWDPGPSVDLGDFQEAVVRDRLRRGDPLPGQEPVEEALHRPAVGGPAAASSGRASGGADYGRCMSMCTNPPGDLSVNFPGFDLRGYCDRQCRVATSGQPIDLVRNCVETVVAANPDARAQRSEVERACRSAYAGASSPPPTGRAGGVVPSGGVHTGAPVCGLLGQGDC